jgi:hypothetical protein
MEAGRSTAAWAEYASNQHPISAQIQKHFLKLLPDAFLFILPLLLCAGHAGRLKKIKGSARSFSGLKASCQ